MMKRIFKLIVVSSFIALSACGGGSSDNPAPQIKPQVSPQKNQSVQFFIAAHPDDIQLFMAKNAQFYIQHKNKNVFILTTAGDGGHEINLSRYSPFSKTFWATRLLAYEKSIHYWNNNQNNIQEKTLEFNQHLLPRRQFGENIVMYNFLLPDGNMQGNGFPTTNFQSLEKLYHGNIKMISSIDQKNKYTKQDFIETLAQIIKYEAGEKEISFNIAEDNLYINQKDHSDHIMTSLLVQDVSQKLNNCMLTNKYTEYVNRAKPINMSSSEYDQHQKMWNVLNSVLVEYKYVNPYARDPHLVWLGKQYISSNTVVNCKNVQEKLAQSLP
ncbi:PIG-L family deacetylase [Acinetobacter sichuanensis]|uniref:PIG-L family deacetylase n=2 Tax=Acinetobacter sichuanensis TaxID=2136183 RepID=A0A371YLZ6_9GAMM|nr:PIG-L family deacetylase [Acinetobacter sichuanensis]RFC82354.1 hypothetical protein C9E89_017120 [Acinetobacter sichuanensis]